MASIPHPIVGLRRVENTILTQSQVQSQLQLTDCKLTIDFHGLISYHITLGIKKLLTTLKIVFELPLFVSFIVSIPNFLQT